MNDVLNEQDIDTKDNSKHKDNQLEDNTEQSTPLEKRVDINDNGKSKRIDEKTTVTKQRAPYLSHKNLKKHNRLIHDAWMHLMDDEIEGMEYKRPNDQKKSIIKRHKLLEPLDKGASVVKKAQEYLNHTKSEKIRIRRKKKHRIIQRSSDFILQKSKADSYITLYERKQNYAHTIQKEDQLKLRKSQSSDDIAKKKINKVFETFNEERMKQSEQKQLSKKSEEDLSEDAMKEREEFIRETKKYFTRNTRDRYNNDANTDRLKKMDGDDDIGISRYDRNSKTEISGKQHVLLTQMRHKDGKHLIDTEREDQYMMDMDFHANDIAERQIQHTENQDRADTDGENMHDQTSTISEKNRTLRSGRLFSQTSENKIDRESTPRRSNMEHDITRTHIKTPLEESKPIVSDNNRRVRVNDLENVASIDSSADDYSSAVVHSHSPKKAYEIIKSDKIENGNAKNGDDDSVLKSEETLKTDTVKPVPDAQTESSKSNVKQSFAADSHDLTQNTGNRSYSHKQRHEQVPIQITKPISWKNGVKVNKKILQQITEERTRAKRSQLTDKVINRDTLKLHIDVVDRHSEDSEHVIQEKKKIIRFWEVVDGKEMRNEKEMFGENEHMNKMLVAKVTKERNMSPNNKTNVSKQSKRSMVTHNAGDFNVSLEVANIEKDTIHACM